MKGMIKAVLFDLDGTLLDRHSSLIIYVHQQMQRCRHLLESIPLAAYLGSVVALDAHGHTAKDIVFQQIEKQFGLPERSWQVLLEDFLNHFPDTCVPFPKMHQTLKCLRDRGLLLGMVTNGSNASQNPKIDGLGIRHLFGAILVSEAEGVKKPESEIFHRALRTLHVMPEETVFVGDHPDADIHAAKSVGLKAVWMETPYWQVPREADAIISELCALPETIDRFDTAEAQHRRAC